MKNPILYNAAAQALTFAFNFAATTSSPFPEIKVRVADSEHANKESKVSIFGLVEGSTVNLFKDNIRSILTTLDSIGALTSSSVVSNATRNITAYIFDDSTTVEVAGHVVTYNSENGAVEIHTKLSADELADLLKEPLPSYTKAKAHAIATSMANQQISI